MTNGQSPIYALAKWIKDTMVQQIEGNPCKGISCVHKEGARDTEIFTVIFSDNKIWEAKELAEVFHSKAEDAVADIPGSQVFCLYGFYDDTNRPRVRRTFRINNSDSIDFGYGTSEPPNEMGQKMQGMRYIEFMFQQNMRHQQYLMDMQYKLIDKFGTGYQRALSESHQVLEVAKTTIIERARVDAERITLEAQKTERLEFIKMIPALANRALGDDIFPTSAVDSKILEGVIDKLNPGNLEKLSEILGPELTGLIVQKGVKMLQQKNEATTLAKRAATNGNGDANEFSLDDNEERPDETH